MPNMSTLIRADLYKSFHRIYLYVFMGVMAALAIAVSAVLAHSQAVLEDALSLGVMLMTYPLYFICMFADIIMAEENKEHSLKNTISFGTPRTALYISKNISTVVVAFAVACVTLGSYLISSFVLLRPAKDDMIQALTVFAQQLGVMLLFYIAAAALAVLLAAVIKKNAMFAFAYFGVLFLPNLLLKIFSYANPVFGNIGKYTLTSQAQSVMSLSNSQLMTPVWFALGYLVLFFAIGLFAFRKQEVS